MKGLKSARENVIIAAVSLLFILFCVGIGIGALIGSC